MRRDVEPLEEHAQGLKGYCDDLFGELVDSNLHYTEQYDERG